MVLNRGRFWSKQADIAESVVKYPVTLVQSGNAIGKSYALAGISLWFAFNRPKAVVVATSPTNVQLEEVFWRQFSSAWQNAWIPLGGRMLRQPLRLDIPGGSYVLAYSTTSTERFSGHHAEHLLAVVDEASGIEPDIWEAIDSLNPSRLLAVGNPLRPSGQFYERCMRARNRIEEGRPDPNVNWMRISSMESPDIHLDRSPRGMADKGWLEKARNDYGEGSMWWRPHVLGEFPEGDSDQLVPRDWLDACVDAPHIPRGRRRLTIDLGGGNDGDRSVLMVRDDNGIYALEADRNWSFEEVARRAKILQDRWGVLDEDCVYDKSAIGHDFKNRLTHVGIMNPRPYIGGSKGNARFTNLRSAAGWATRQRLDPKRRGPDGNIQPPFSIQARWMGFLRPELQAIQYKLNEKSGKTELVLKSETAKILGHSPDVADTLIMSNAFP